MNSIWKHRRVQLQRASDAPMLTPRARPIVPGPAVRLATQRLSAELRQARDARGTRLLDAAARWQPLVEVVDTLFNSLNPANPRGGVERFADGEKLGGYETWGDHEPSVVDVSGGQLRRTRTDGSGKVDVYNRETGGYETYQRGVLVGVKARMDSPWRRVKDHGDGTVSYETASGSIRRVDEKTMDEVSETFSYEERDPAGETVTTKLTFHSNGDIEIEKSDGTRILLKSDGGIESPLRYSVLSGGDFDPGLPDFSSAFSAQRRPGERRHFDPTPHVDRDAEGWDAPEPSRPQNPLTNRLNPEAYPLEENSSPLFGRQLRSRNYGRVDPSPADEPEAAPNVPSRQPVRPVGGRR